jgi:hypothetical protein
MLPQDLRLLTIPNDIREVVLTEIPNGARVSGVLDRSDLKCVLVCRMYLYRRIARKRQSHHCCEISFQILTAVTGGDGGPWDILLLALVGSGGCN